VWVVVGDEVDRLGRRHIYNARALCVVTVGERQVGRPPDSHGPRTGHNARSVLLLSRRVAIYGCPYVIGCLQRAAARLLDVRRPVTSIHPQCPMSAWLNRRHDICPTDSVQRVTHTTDCRSVRLRCTNCPRSRTEVKPTALPFLLTLTVTFDLDL